MLGRLSLATHDSHLGFTHADVSIIIVVTDAERQELAAMFPQLDGKIRIWDEFSKPREDC
jgi:hypothetical protein